MRSIRIIVLAAVMAAVVATSASAFGFNDQSYIIPKGVVGKPYSHKFEIRKGGGSPPYHYRLLQDTKLPPGLTLGKDDGMVTGTPTEAGKWHIWLEGYDSGKAAGFWDMATQRDFTFDIMPAEAQSPSPGSSATSADQGISGERKSTMFDVTAYGAKGDGKTDDTAAIQRALDAAAAVQGTVVIPSGNYMCSTLHVPPFVGITGQANFSYGLCGGSILRLNDPKAKCLLDLSRAAGGTITGISMHGMDLGKDIHGMYAGDVPAGDKKGDTFRIDNCAIRGFTGDGIRFDPAGIFIVRHCEIKANAGNGIYVHGWDGWILDNMLAGNGKSGFCGDVVNASITITANRIEWNHDCGVFIRGGGHYNINGNYFDRSGGPAINLVPSEKEKRPSCIFAITGNVIYRSGRNVPADSDSNCQVRFEKAHGVTFTGNTMCVGQDDSGKGDSSPSYGIVVHDLENCVIADNTLHCGATKKLVLDLGNEKNVVLKDNVGSVYKHSGTMIWASPQW